MIKIYLNVTCNKMEEKITDFILFYNFDICYILCHYYYLATMQKYKTLKSFLSSAKYSLKLECKIVFDIFVKVLKSLLIRLHVLQEICYSSKATCKLAEK